MTKKKSYSLREEAKQNIRQSLEKKGEMDLKGVEFFIHELQAHQIKLKIQNQGLRTSQQLITPLPVAPKLSGLY